MNSSQLFPDANTLLLNQGLAELTTCEWKFLINLARDLTNAELAEILCLSTKSVENYKTRLGHKLNLRGHHKLAKFARQHGVVLNQWYNEHVIIPPPPPQRVTYGRVSNLILQIERTTNKYKDRIFLKLRGFSPCGA